MAIRITPLQYDDELLAELDMPKSKLRILRGLGSGLARDPRDAGRVWAVGDRGPNMKVKVAAELYGLKLDAHGSRKGAKVMPALDIGPALVALRLEGDRVVPERVLPLVGADGRAASGLPIPGGAHADLEPAIGVQGEDLGADVAGADTEGVAISRDGCFWVGDEYGPSLLRVDADGRVFERWVPEGMAGCFGGAGVEIVEALPAVAKHRRLNRGFEAIVLTEDERELHLMFQGPLAHPDDKAFEAARHVRLMTLDVETRRVVRQFAYACESAESFRRDMAKGDFAQEDVKVSEVTRLPDGALLVLERGSETTKLFRIDPRSGEALPPEHLEDATRPTLEELSARGFDGLPVLEKRLVLDTDDHPQVGADLEGMTVLPDGSLILVNDNDFGCEGAETRFWRVEGLSVS